MLRKADGKAIAQDGYYDMRVVAVDPATGKQIIAQDFQDIPVKNGQYTLPVTIPKFSNTGDSTFQVCHSDQPTITADGLNGSEAPNGCKDPVMQKKVFVEAECPQTLEISSGNLVFSLTGNRNASLSGNGCTYVSGDSNLLADSNKQAPSVVSVQGEKGDTGATGAIGLQGAQGETGPQGPAGPAGADGTSGASGLNGANGTAGAIGAQGPQGPAGDPASDDQTISFGGANILSIAGGNSVDLSSLADNTDVLASLTCTVGQIAQWNGSVWACASPAASSDSQTLSLAANNLSILNGNSVSLAAYLDNTDAQSISMASNVLSISGNASTVNLAPYLDNTDSQALSLGGNTLTLVNGGSVSLAPYLDNTDSQDLSLTGSTLSLSGDGTTVSLATFLDNTDVLAGLSCSANQIPKWNGAAWTCGTDVDTVLNESQVDAYVANNGYLSTEVDGSTTNELQNLTFAGNVLGLTSSGVSFNLSSYLDNTDAQGISLVGNTLSISGNAATVSLASYLDNTDAQSISMASNVLSISGNASTVNLAPYLDNTDAQTLSYNTGTHILSISAGNTADLTNLLDNTDAQGISLASNTLSISGNASTVNLAPYLDNTDSQIISLVGNTLSISGSGGTVNLAGYLDNTDVLASLACSINQIAKYNGSAWACAADTGLTSEVDGVVGNEVTDATASGGLTRSGSGSGVSPYTLGIAAGGVTNAMLVNSSVTVAAGTGLTGGGSVALGGTVTLSSSLGTSVDSSEIVDGTIATADIAANAITSALVSDGSLTSSDLSATAGITNAQLANSAVTITAGTGLTGGGSVALGGSVTLNSSLGTTVDTSEIVDGTILFADIAQNGCSINQVMKWNGSAWACASLAGSQNLFETISAPSGTASVADSATDTLAFANGSGISITSDGTTDSVTIAATLGTTVDTSEIVDGTITGADIASSTVTNANLVNSSVTVTAGTGLTGGGSVALGGSLTLNSAFGAGIDSGEITDGTIAAIDIASGAITTSKIANCSSDGQILKYTIAGGWACAADSDTTYTTGTGISINGSNVIASTLGVDIDSSEIVDGTVALIDLAANSVNSSKIVDGAISNADLANSAVTVTAGTGLTGGGAVTLGSSITLNLANDFGVSIDSSEITDGTVALADLAANSVNSSKIVDGAIATVDVADGAITLAKLANCSTDGQILKYYATDPDGAGPLTTGWNCTADNGLTSEVDGVVGNEVTDATASGGLTRSGSGTGGSPYTLGISAGGVSNAMLTNSAVTVTAGTGLTGGGNVSLGGTVTLNSSLGTDIDSSEIVNGTITAADVAGNVFVEIGRATAQTDASTNSTIFINKSSTGNLVQMQQAGADKFVVNNSGIVTTASVNSASIVDGTVALADLAANSVDSSKIVDGSVANADLANSSLTVTAGTGLTGGGAVSLGGTVTLNSAFGTAIDTTEISDGTITFADLSQNGCSTNQIPKWNGSAWACAADVTGGSINSFETISTTSGTSPVADSSTDTLTLTSGSGVTITGDNTTDTITLAAVLGTDITSGEIVDGTIVSGDLSATAGITNAQLANSAVTVSAGSGLINGGSASLGGTTTLNIGAGNGITVNADDIAVRAAVSTDGLSATTSSGSGLEVLASGVALLQGCSDGQILKWNETLDVWACSADAGLTSEVDGIIGNEVTDATASGGLTRSGSGTAGTPYTLGISTGGVTNAMLANSSIIIANGTGISGGATVSLGGTVTLNSTLGTDIAASEVVADALDFSELKDAMTLDATTTIALGINSLNINLDSTGNFNVQDGGVNVLTINSTNGTALFQNSTDSAAAFTVKDSSALPIFNIDTTSNAVSVGTLVDDAADTLLVLDGVSGADPTGIAGGMYYNTTSAKFRCYENGAWINCIQSGYSINVQALTSSPTDAQTVYFGTLPKAPVTTAATSKVYIRKTGTIKRAEIYTFSGTAGTNEAWSIYVRKNNTTDTLIATVSAATSERVFSNAAINIAVTAGDYVEIKGIQPTWATNPLTTVYGGYLYIE